MEVRGVGFVDGIRDSFIGGFVDGFVGCGGSADQASKVV
jgi:hypothetical protein